MVDEDAVIGDLEETFREIAEHSGIRAARRWYWDQVVRSAPRFILTSIRWSFIMLFNYVRLTLRHLQRHKGHAAVNVMGLAIGLASCLLILRYVADESGYDRFHERSETLHRLNWDFNWNETEGIGSGTPPPLATRLVADFPEIEAATRIYPVSPQIVRSGDRMFVENRIRAVDPNFLDVFSFRMVDGDAATAFSAPNSAVLTVSTARKYFGDEPAMGKPITIGDAGEFLGRPYDEHFTVTGVIADPPRSSHLEFDLLTSMASHPQVAYFDWSWIWMQVVTYAVVAPGTNLADVEARMIDMVATYAPDAFRRVGFSYDELIQSGGRWNFVFQPVTDIYLGSNNIGNRLGSLGNPTYLTIFSILAAFILLIACINFMNLSTAQSVTRAREIGIRKVLGSFRRGLVGRFMTEAMLFSALAMLMGIGIAMLVLPPFSDFAGKELSGSLLEPAWLPLALIAFTALVGLLAGSYPSLYLSSFAPIDVLKTKFAPTKKSLGLRHGLVVFQFAISIAMICCTLIVRDQLRFFGEADLGFDRAGVVVVSNLNHRLSDKAKTYEEQVEVHADIVSASLSTGAPPYYGFQDYYKIEGRADEQFDLISYLVDNDFVETLGIEIIEGRGFTDDHQTNTTSVILNETAVARFGLDDPIGKTIQYPSQTTYTIIGVMRDFNFNAMQQPILPFALFHETSESYDIPDSYVVVRVRPGRYETAIAALEETWQEVAPGVPFEYSFLDENFGAQYRAEQRLGSLFFVFAGLAIFIACLGLLGLAAFTVEQRTKEIGIRKTFGATSPGMMALLSRDFSKWVLAANLLAWPLAWYGMSEWLAGFAYRVEMGYGAFLVSGLVALVIALATVGYHTRKAAIANPIEALRYE